jgi:hypothetical protein
MLGVARREGLRALRDHGRKKRLANIDPKDLHDRQHRSRSFRHWRDDLGMIRVSGALVPEVGVPFVNRLDAQTDRCRRAAKQRGDEPETQERYAADAFATMLAGSGGVGPRATRADVVLVWDLSRDAGHIIGGGPVPWSTVWEFIDRDAFMKGLTHDGTKIDTIRHFGKNPPALLRTALDLGRPPDFEGPRCTKPGCDRRHHLEFDHIDPRANGGAWSLGNIDPYCWYDHVEKTERDRAAGLLGKDPPRGSSP